jgi:glycosyltransferase involved in cell wall biosynthesis
VADLVSVVMPCFNAAPYLRAAIESVREQDYRPHRLTVVDDGSTDNSAAVARTFGSAIELIQQSNQGISAARNAGVRRARGPYIAFCDADDLWPEGSLAARIQVLLDQPPIDYVFGLVQNFISPELDAQQARLLAFPTEPVVGRMAGALVVRRGAFDRVGPFSTACEVGETVEWLTRADDAGLVGHGLDRVVMRRRIHGTNTTLRAPAPTRQYLHILKASLDRRRAEVG